MNELNKAMDESDDSKLKIYPKERKSTMNVRKDEESDIMSQSNNLLNNIRTRKSY